MTSDLTGLPPSPDDFGHFLTDGPERPVGSIVTEAENYDRGNTREDLTGFGSRI